MSESMDLTQVEKETRQVMNQDGLVYLFMGLLLALVALSLTQPQLAFLGGLAALLIFPLELVRRRITYPRVGYVRFAAPSGFARGLVGFLVVAVAVLVFFAFFGNGRLANYLPLVISGVFCLAYYFGASMQGLRRRDWLVMGLMVVSGAVALALFSDWHQAVALQLGMTAVILMVIGLADLIRFLRTYPVIDTPES